MQHSTLPVELLDGHSKNYLTHPPEQLKKLAASLRRFSQVRSIVVRRNGDRYTVLAGHGIVAAAKSVKLEALHCDIVPDDWDDATAQAYLVADNAHAQAAQIDEETLLALLQEDKENGNLLDALGSSEKELEQLALRVKNSHASDFLQAYLLEKPEPASVPTMTTLTSGTVSQVFPTTTTTQTTPFSVEIAGNAPTTGGFHPSTTTVQQPLPMQPPINSLNAQYFPMTYTFTYPQRDVVIKAINTAKEEHGVQTSTEALEKICQYYLDESV